MWRDGKEERARLSYTACGGLDPTSFLLWRLLWRAKDAQHRMQLRCFCGETCTWLPTINLLESRRQENIDNPSCIFGSHDENVCMIRDRKREGGDLIHRVRGEFESTHASFWCRFGRRA